MANSESQPSSEPAGPRFPLMFHSHPFPYDIVPDGPEEEPTRHALREPGSLCSETTSVSRGHNPAEQPEIDRRPIGTSPTAAFPGSG